MIIPHGPTIAGEIAANAITSSKLATTALDAHIARGTTTLAGVGGHFTVDTGLTSPVMAVGNLTTSADCEHCKIAYLSAGGSQVVFCIMSQGSVGSAFVAVAATKTISWVAWET